MFRRPLSVGGDRDGSELLEGVFEEREVRVTRLLEQARCELVTFLLCFELGPFDLVLFALKMPCRRFLLVGPKPDARKVHSVRLASGYRFGGIVSETNRAGG